MTEPRTVGAVFWHTMHYPDGLQLPLINRSHTTEIDPPFRHGPCVILRAPLSKRALVLGRWADQLNADEAMRRALSLRVTDDNGAGWSDDLV